jgi:hypothetical protein
MTDNNFNSIEEAFKAGRDFERNRIFAVLNEVLKSLFLVSEEKEIKNTPTQKQDYKNTPPAPKRASEPKIHTMTNWKLYQGENKLKNKKGWGDLY